MAGGKKFGIGEWVAIFGLAAITVAVTEFVGISQKWENATVYTVLVFTVVIIGGWPRLSNRRVAQAFESLANKTGGAPSFAQFAKGGKPTSA